MQNFFFSNLYNFWDPIFVVVVVVVAVVCGMAHKLS
jgi:hypothetical protein